jgi:hypothetical protein
MKRGRGIERGMGQGRGGSREGTGGPRKTDKGSKQREGTGARAMEGKQQWGEANNEVWWWVRSNAVAGWMPDWLVWLACLMCDDWRC